MNISTTDAQGLYTKQLIEVYKESIQPTEFLGTFFTPVEKSSLELSIEVQRGFEKIAVDVERGSDGNRNNFSKSTEKIFIPPYYREYFDMTSLDLYDRLFGSTEITDAQFADLINNGVEKMQELVNKIKRTYEFQRSQVLETGVVTFEQGPVGSIDFKRKAGSLVDVGGDYFATTTDPFGVFAKGCVFLRTVGKSAGAVYNAILGETALNDLLTNAKFIERQDLTNMRLDAVREPVRNSVGAAYRGRITAGSYLVDLWTYPQYYQDANGVMQPYINAKKVIMIPDAPNFKMGYAAVPQLLSPGQQIRKGAFIFSDYMDLKKKTHEFHVESAGVPIPVAVDQIYTFKAVS